MCKEAGEMLLEAINKVILLTREVNHQVPKEVTGDTLWHYLCELQSIESLLTRAREVMIHESVKKYLEKEVV